MTYSKLLVVAGALAALAVPSAAMASTGTTTGTTTCANAIADSDAGVQSYLPALVTNNLNVPAGAICRLYGTEVQGTITVGKGATLHVIGDAYGDPGLIADSNVTVTQGFFLSNNSFHVKGNMTIDGVDQSQGDPYNWNNGFWSDAGQSFIDKNLTVKNNLGGLYTEGSIVVGGTFNYSNNTHSYTGNVVGLKGTSIS
jgi:hypothetical protein